MRLCYSNLACPDWSFERTVEAVAAYGFDGLEVRLFDGEVVTPGTSAQARRRAEAALRSSGVAVAALDTSLRLSEGRRPFLEGVAAMAEIAQQWGAPLIRVFGGPLPAGHLEREAALEEAGALLVEAAPVAARHGVGIALETHDDFSSAHVVARVMQMAQGAVGAVYDSHHPHRMGETPSEVLDVLGPHVWHAQAKDARRLPGDDAWQLVPLGQGEVPVRDMVALLSARGYQGWLSLEFEKKWHPELAPPEVALRPQAELLRAWVGGR